MHPVMQEAWNRDDISYYSIVAHPRTPSFKAVKTALYTTSYGLTLYLNENAFYGAYRFSNNKVSLCKGNMINKAFVPKTFQCTTLSITNHVHEAGNKLLLLREGL